MSSFWGGKSWFMANHPPGMAVKHYRILGFVHFGSSSCGVGAERDAQVLGSASCTSVLTFVCPNLWLTLNHTACTVCPLSQSPGNCSAECLSPLHLQRGALLALWPAQRCCVLLQVLLPSISRG